MTSSVPGVDWAATAADALRELGFTLLNSDRPAAPGVVARISGRVLYSRGPRSVRRYVVVHSLRSRHLRNSA